MSVVINELEIIPGPAVEQPSVPPTVPQTTNPSPTDLEAVVARLRERAERVRAT